MAAVGGISLFRSGRGGNIRARWGKGKHRIDWNTGTKNEEEALRRAAEELRRRSGSSAAPLGTPESRPAPAAAPPSPQPPAVASPASSPAGFARRPQLGDALARVLVPSSPAAGGAAPSVASPTPPPAAVVPDAVIAAGQGELEKAAQEKVRHVHKVVGKACTYGLEGALKRMCRWAGREPEDIDDDEEELIREGFEELAAKYLGTKKISPAGKVLAGGIAAGFGMYMAGKEIPKPKPAPAPLQLVPKQPAPGPDGDGGKSA